MLKISTTILALILLSYNMSLAQDGSLDNSFGQNGIVSVDHGNDDSRIYGMIKAGDKLVACGFTSEGTSEKFTVIQFNLDGSVDTNFGTNGRLIPTLGNGNGRATSIIQQPDGRIVAAGWSRYSNKEQYVVIRFTSSGILDPNFGEDGIKTGSFSTSSFAEDEIAEVGLMSDGKIVVAGRSYNGQNEDAFVACFNDDGSLNTAFDGNGYSIIEFDVTPPSESATCLTIDEQDNVFIGGSVATSFNDEDAFFLLKMDKNGVWDNSFGDGGKIFHAVSPTIIAILRTIALDDEGRIVTGGGAFDVQDADNNFFLTRYMPNGTRDFSFANGGSLIIPGNSNESLHDINIRPWGDIIAAGSTGGFSSRFAVLRLGESGQLDPSFGNQGITTTLIESTFNGISAIAVDNEAIYAGGFGRDDENYNMALAKYVNTGMASSINSLSVQAKDLEIFPNPIVDDYRLSIDLSIASNLEIRLYNAIGQPIQIVLPKQTTQAGLHQFDFKLPQGIARGVYFLTAIVDDGSITKMIQN